MTTSQCEMIRCSQFLFKAPRFTGGLTKKQYYRKQSKPGSTKPWTNARVTTTGEIELSPSYNAVGDDSRAALGNIATMAPLGVSQDYDTELMRRKQFAEQELAAVSVSDSSSSSLLIEHVGDGPNEQEDKSALISQETNDDTPLQYEEQNSAVDETALPVLSTIPVGHTLNMNVHAVKTYGEDEEPIDSTLKPMFVNRQPVPLALQKFRRSPRDRRESVRLPRHLNQLFQKLMRLSEEAVKIDESAPLVVPPRGVEEGDPNATAKLESASPEARAQFQRTKQRLRYGALMDAFENDKHAIEHNLELAGEKFERQFLEWDGLHIMDTATAEVTDVRNHKTSIIMNDARAFNIPIMDRDPCQGCGAVLQNKNESEYGYCAPDSVEKYIHKHHAMMQRRAEYADRMAELQAHWEKNGRRVGEEWLDFMTQEEFESIYRYHPKPFICQRCTKLVNKNHGGRRTLFPAPDFTEQLRALKEKSCVVVLVVDITDFPGSMVYDLPGLISMNNPVIIAVNKMDCVRQRRFGYTGPEMSIVQRSISEKHVSNWVTTIATQFGLPKHAIKAVVPVSSKMGWGVENLIREIEIHTNLSLRYNYEPKPAYFVGVANVGKSSLINAIAQALYVPLPPTPQSTKVYGKKIDRKTGKERIFWRWYTPPHAKRDEMQMISAYRNKAVTNLLTTSSLPGTTVAVNAVQLALTGDNKGKTFLYDTPGLFPHWHQSMPFCIYHMRQCLIRKFRNPDCYILLPGSTFFLTGAVALDLVKGSNRGVLLMVYCSQKLRHSLAPTETSNEFWAEQLGRALYPPSSLEEVGDQRLTESRTYLFECFGRHRKVPKADIYVCGIGWVSFCVAEPCDVVFRVRTLPGIVHGVREPLRYKDLRGFKSWPRMRRSHTARPSPPSMDRVVRLVAKEVNPDAPPLEVVEKTRHVKHAAAASNPFEDVVAALQSQGKLA